MVWGRTSSNARMAAFIPAYDGRGRIVIATNDDGVVDDVDDGLVTIIAL